MSQLVRLEGKHTTQNAHCALVEWRTWCQHAVVYSLFNYRYTQHHEESWPIPCPLHLRTFREWQTINVKYYFQSTVVMKAWKLVGACYIFFIACQYIFKQIWRVSVLKSILQLGLFCLPAILRGFYTGCAIAANQAILFETTAEVSILDWWLVMVRFLPFSRRGGEVL